MWDRTCLFGVALPNPSRHEVTAWGTLRGTAPERPAKGLIPSESNDRIRPYNHKRSFMVSTNNQQGRFPAEPSSLERYQATVSPDARTAARRSR